MALSVTEIQELAAKSASQVDGLKKVDPTPSSLEILFHNRNLVDLFTSYIGSACQRSFSQNCAAVGMTFQDDDSRWKMESLVEELKNEFDKGLLLMPFKEDWLDTYLTNRNFGISGVTSLSYVGKPSKLEQILKSDLEEQEAVLHSQFLRRANHLEAAELSLKDVVEHLSDFVIENCEGYDSEGQVRSFLQDLVETIVHASSKIDMINLDYSEDIQSALVSFCNLRRPKDRPQNLTAIVHMFSLNEEIPTEKRNLFLSLCKASLDALNESLPNLMLKGLRALPDGLQTAPDLESEFKGLDINEPGAPSFQYRMTPSVVLYEMQRPGRCLSFTEQLSEAITSYVLTIMEYRHSEFHKRALIDLSKRLDGEEYLNLAHDLIINTRPVLR